MSAFSGVLLEMSRVNAYEEINFIEIEKIIDVYKKGYINENYEQLLISEEVP
jgi:hypothetical protein